MRRKEVHRRRRDNARSCSREADAGAVEHQEQKRACDEGQRGGQNGRNHRHANCKTSKQKILIYPVSIHQPGSAWAAPTNDVYIYTSPRSHQTDCVCPASWLECPKACCRPSRRTSAPGRTGTRGPRCSGRRCTQLCELCMQILHSRAARISKQRVKSAFKNQSIPERCSAVFLLKLRNTNTLCWNNV